jgi:hypothetical protein
MRKALLPRGAFWFCGVGESAGESDSSAHEIPAGIAQRCKHLARMRAEKAISLGSHAADACAKHAKNAGFLRGAESCARICENAAGKGSEKLPCR